MKAFAISATRPWQLLLLEIPIFAAALLIGTVSLAQVNNKRCKPFTVPVTTCQCNQGGEAPIDAVARFPRRETRAMATCNA